MINKKSISTIIILVLLLMVFSDTESKVVKADEALLESHLTIELELMKDTYFYDGIISTEGNYVTIGSSNNGFSVEESKKEKKNFIVSYSDEGVMNWIVSDELDDDIYFKDIIEMNNDLLIVSGEKQTTETIDNYQSYETIPIVIALNHSGEIIWDLKLKPGNDYNMNFLNGIDQNSFLVGISSFNNKDHSFQSAILEIDPDGVIIDENTIDNYLVSYAEKRDDKMIVTGMDSIDWTFQSSLQVYDSKFQLIKEVEIEHINRFIGTFEITNNGEIIGFGNYFHGGSIVGNYVYKLNDQYELLWVKSLEGDRYYPEQKFLDHYEDYRRFGDDIFDMVINEKDEVFMLSSTGEETLIIKLDQEGNIDEFMSEPDLFAFALDQKEDKYVTFGSLTENIIGDDGEYIDSKTSAVIKVYTNPNYVETQIPEIHEIYGTSRFSTAVEISKNMYIESDTVILALGTDFPDALSAGPLARHYNAPILLVKETEIPKATMDEINRLGAQKIILLGGGSAINQSVENQLIAEGIIDIHRIQGSNRYATAVEAAKVIRNGETMDTVVLANGSDFADALSAGSYASMMGYPILLTGNKNLSTTTEDALIEYQVKNVVIMGGEAAVSNLIEEKIKGIGIETTRISGSNRFNTAIDLATKNFPGSEELIIANGMNYADALSAAPYAAKHNAPIILVQEEKLSSGVKEYLLHKTAKKITIIGGFSAISNSNREAIQTIMTK